jgi:hypothetical protein
MTTSEERSRLLALLADRATVGISERQTLEVRRLLGDHPDVEPDEFDLTAAAVDLALAEDLTDPLPPHLRERLLRAAHNRFRAPPV